MSSTFIAGCALTKDTVKELTLKKKRQETNQRRKEVREQGSEGKDTQSERQNSVHIPGSPLLKLYFHLVIFQGNLGGPPKVLDILMHFSSFTYTQPL